MFKFFKQIQQKIDRDASSEEEEKDEDIMRYEAFMRHIGERKSLPEGLNDEKGI